MIFTPLVKVMAVIILGLMLALGFVGLRAKALASDRDAHAATAALCASVNASQVDAITVLQTRNAELVSKNASDLAAAQKAAATYLALESQYDALQDENEALRDDLHETDPRAGEWLAAGMPRSVACSLWEGPACTNAGR